MLGKNKKLLNINDWLEQMSGVIFHVTSYRNPEEWFPYSATGEKQVGGMPKYAACVIENAIELPDGDVLLGLRYLSDDSPDAIVGDYIDFQKLSDVNLICTESN